MLAQKNVKASAPRLDLVLNLAVQYQIFTFDQAYPILSQISLQPATSAKLTQR